MKRSLIGPLCLAAAASLVACMGVDVSSIRRADESPPLAGAGVAVATGSVRFIVDGAPLVYGFLNRPTLSLYHRGQGRLMASPEVSGDGSFRWQLPAGDYGVAVIFGGMPPTGQAHRLPGGALVFVNGIVDPGLEFTLSPGAVQSLGTLVIEVESRPAQGILAGSERVFARLVDIRVETGSAPSASQFRRIARQAH